MYIQEKFYYKEVELYYIEDEFKKYVSIPGSDVKIFGETKDEVMLKTKSYLDSLCVYNNHTELAENIMKIYSKEVKRICPELLKMILKNYNL